MTFFRLTTAIFSLCALLAMVRAADVTLTRNQDGGYAITTPTYTAIVNADGNLATLRVDGTDFLLNDYHGAVAGAFSRIQESTATWAMQTDRFTTVVQRDATTLAVSTEKRELAYHFETDAIELRFGKNLDYGTWHFTLHPSLSTIVDQLTGKDITLRKLYEAVVPQIFAPSGASITLPRGTLYYSARNIRTPTADDPHLHQLYVPRFAAMRIDIHAQPTDADRLSMLLHTERPHHIFASDEPMRFIAEGKLRIPGNAVAADLEVVASDYLTKEERYRKVVPINITSTAPQQFPFVFTLPPGIYAGHFSVRQGDSTFFSREFHFVSAPEKIALPPVPDDFDRFWDETLHEQEAIPADVQMSLAQEGEGWKLYTMRFTGLQGRQFHAWLSLPTKPGRYPAQLTLPPSGINPPYKPECRPDMVGMSLAIAGQEVTPPAGGYKQWMYFTEGIEQRETWYYRTVFAACSRAVDILAARPETDPQRIMVHGSSQGGGLTFITAALNSKVDMAFCSSPGLFGLEWKLRYLGKDFWPPIDPMLPNGKVDANALDARIAVARYGDAANFAHRITCPVFIASGLQDTVTSQAATVVAFYRLTNAPVRALLVDPWGKHSGPAPTARMFSEWRNAFINNTPATVIQRREVDGLPIVLMMK
jgi:cephalosporin-C deacetylase-like acetyl esterase